MPFLAQWANQHANLILAGAAIIQAVAAGLIAYLTYRLAQSTENYAKLTRGLLDLQRSQFDREWQPNLHSTLFLEGSEVRLRIVNLSRNAVVVTHLFVNIEGKEGRGQVDLDIPIPGLVQRESADLSGSIWEAVLPHVDEHAWSGVLKLSVGFLMAGIPSPSNPVFYHASMHNGHVTELHAKRSPIVWEHDT